MTEVAIHPTAVIDPAARLGEGVRVGPYAVIGPEVELGDGCQVGSGAQLAGPSVFGRENRIFAHACLGFEPQDLKFQGERSVLEVGSRNTFREFCTVHRGTALGGGVTRIGDGNLFMAYTHVAHDCLIGSSTIFGNCATLAGHVEVHDHAILSGFAAVHQFCRVGSYAYIGGFSIITMDALPFVRSVGQKPVCLGLNRIGLQRKGFDEERLRVLEGAMRILVRSGLNSAQALERLEREYPGHADVAYLVDYVRGSERGVIKTPPGKRGSRGAEVAT